MNSLFRRTNQLRMIDMIGHRGNLFLSHRWSRSWGRDMNIAKGWPLEGPSYSWGLSAARTDSFHNCYVSNESFEHYYYGGSNFSEMLEMMKFGLGVR